MPGDLLVRRHRRCGVRGRPTTTRACPPATAALSRARPRHRPEHAPAGPVRGAAAGAGAGGGAGRGAPPLVLLDEPTRGLDYAAKRRLVETLRELADQGHAVLLATHDVELAAEVANRVRGARRRRGRGGRPDQPTSSSARRRSRRRWPRCLAPRPWLTVAEVAAAAGRPRRDRRAGSHRGTPCARGRAVGARAGRRAWSASSRSAGRCSPAPASACSAHDADAPVAVRGAAAAADRGRAARRASPTAAWTRRRWRCSACWPPSARRCGRSAPALPASSRCSSCSILGRAGARAGLRLRARRAHAVQLGALLTGGVGPWLPFQMLAAGWVGFFAGLPAAGHAAAARSAAGGVRRGGRRWPTASVMNLWFWPFRRRLRPRLSFVPGAPMADEPRALAARSTSRRRSAWDLAARRANVVLVVVAGRPCCARCAAPRAGRVRRPGRLRRPHGRRGGCAGRVMEVARCSAPGRADGWPNPLLPLRVVHAAARGTRQCAAQTSALVDGRLLLDCGPEAPRAGDRAGRDTRRGPPRAAHPRAPGPLPRPAALLFRSWAADASRSTCSARRRSSTRAADWVGPDDPVRFAGGRAGRPPRRSAATTCGCSRPRTATSTPAPCVLYDVTAPDGGGCSTPPTPARCRQRRRVAVTRRGVRRGAARGDVRRPAPSTAPTTSTSRPSPRSCGGLREPRRRRRRRPTSSPSTSGHHNPPPAELAARLAAWGPASSTTARCCGRWAARAVPRPRHAGARRGAGPASRPRPSDGCSRQPDGHLRRDGGSAPDDAEWAARVAAHRARRPPLADGRDRSTSRACCRDGRTGRRGAGRLRGAVAGRPSSMRPASGADARDRGGIPAPADAEVARRCDELVEAWQARRHRRRWSATRSAPA